MTSLSDNPGTYKGGRGLGGVGGGVASPPKVFPIFFFLDDKTSAPKVFYSCSFNPRVVSYFGYDMWRHK